MKPMGYVNGMTKHEVAFLILADELGIKVHWRKMLRTAGYASRYYQRRPQRTIVLAKFLASNEYFRRRLFGVMVHELAHHLVGDCEAARPKMKTRAREYRVEGVVSLVARYYGTETDFAHYFKFNGDNDQYTPEMCAHAAKIVAGLNDVMDRLDSRLAA